MRGKKGGKTRFFLVKGHIRQYKSSVREVMQLEFKEYWYIYMFDYLITSLTLLVFKSFKKKTSITQYCAIDLLDLWPHLFCDKNLNYVKNLISIQIQTVSSLNIAPTVGPLQSYKAEDIYGYMVIIDLQILCEVKWNEWGYSHHDLYSDK